MNNQLPVIDETTLLSMGKGELLFGDLVEQQQHELLRRVIVENQDEAGEWRPWLGGVATRAFLISVEGLINIGVRKFRKPTSYEEIIGFEDCMHNFIASKNIGQLAKNFLAADVSISTRIVGESRSTTGRYVHANSHYGLRIPSGLIAYKIFEHLKSIEELGGLLSSQDYIDAVQLSGSTKGYRDNIPEEIGRAVYRFGDVRPIVTEQISIEEESDKRLLIDSDLDDDELVGEYDIVVDQRTAGNDIEDAVDRINSIQDFNALPWPMLPRKNREILLYRYGIPDHNSIRKLEDVGKEFGLTRERIRQIVDESIRLLLDPDEVMRERVEHKKIREIDMRYKLYRAGLVTDPRPLIDDEDSFAFYSRAVRVFEGIDISVFNTFCGNYEQLSYVRQRILDLYVGRSSDSKAMDVSTISSILGMEEKSVISLSESTLKIMKKVRSQKNRKSKPTKSRHRKVHNVRVVPEDLDFIRSSTPHPARKYNSIRLTWN